jgi:FecR-like protein
MSPHWYQQLTCEKMLILMLIFAISCLYIPAPYLAATSTPIGQMVVSGATSPTQSESTVFSGDVVTTARNQAAAITLKNSSLLNVAASSTARFEQGSGCYRVGLTRGEVSFSSSKLSHEGLKIQSSGVEVSVPAASTVRGKVVSTPEYVLVSALSGGIQVASNGKTYSVKEGDSSVIPTAVASNDSSQDQKSDSTTNNKKKAGAATGAGVTRSGLFGMGAAATAAVIVGAGVGTGIIIWAATKEDSSPSRP